MNSNIHENEHDDDSQRSHLLKTQQPFSYQQTITIIDKKEHMKSDEMTTPNWERCPLRRVNVINGPQSAFARLFPDKYRQQEEFNRTQRSQSNDNRYRSVDRITVQHTISDDDDDDDDDCQERISHSRQVRFYTNEGNFLKTRAKSEPYLDRIHLSSECSNNNINYDPNPEIIYRNNRDDIVYTQRVGVRYLRPPTPPPPGPILIREIQSTPPNDPPPLVFSGTPPIPPRTPSPLIVREQPPTPPQYQPAKVITKTLPPPPVPPRRVIIKRKPPLPAKPRPVIIEKWLPYKTAPERPILYQRAENTEHKRPVPRNVILQYEPARVKIKQEVQNFGCFRVDPTTYRAQYGPLLRRTDEIQKVLQNIGCNTDLITSTGYSSCYSSSLNQNNNFSHYDYPRHSTTCFTDEQLDALIGTSIRPPPTAEHHYDIPKVYHEDHNYGTNISSAV